MTGEDAEVNAGEADPVVPAAVSESLDGGFVDPLNRLPLSGGVAQAVRSGASGDALTLKGVIAAIGGPRGVAETLIPGLLFLVMFTLTRDARVSAIVPALLTLLAVVIRLVLRESLVSALSGAFGVGIAVVTTLVTGRGEDFYLWGFVVNAAWAFVLLISVLIRWPLLGFVFGGLRGDMTGWRRVPGLQHAALWLTVVWMGVFVARLAVQLPMYVAGAVNALGIARLVMGAPLFAIVVVFTWMAASRLGRAHDTSDDSSAKNVEITRRNASGG